MSKQTFGIGIIGCGMIAHFHAKAIAAMEGAEVVACFERNPERGQEFGETYGCQAYAELDQMLANPAVDVVTICTPSGAHMDPAIAAAKAGKHILVEKPVDVSIDKIDAMIAAAEENGVQLASILPRRFNGGTIKLKEAVESGRFGQLSLIEAVTKWYRTQEYYDSGAWRGTWALDGGGALMNQSIHTIDLLLNVAGEVDSVCAFADLLAHENIEVEDTAVAILNFKNGAKGIIQGSTACYSEEGHAAEVNICGVNGSAFLKDDKFTHWEFREEQAGDKEFMNEFGFDPDAGGAGAADPSAIDFSWHQKNFEEVLDAIREGRKIPADAYEGRKSVELIQAIYQSALNGGAKVTLPLEKAPELRSFR